MSGRPRLVEEGEPIAWASKSQGGGHVDGDGGRSNGNHPQHHTQKLSSNASSTVKRPSKTSGLSSLQQAAAGTGLPKLKATRQSKVETSFEIGGDTGNSDDDDEAMALHEEATRTTHHKSQTSGLASSFTIGGNATNSTIHSTTTPNWNHHTNSIESSMTTPPHHQDYGNHHQNQHNHHPHYQHRHHHHHPQHQYQIHSANHQQHHNHHYSIHDHEMEEDHHSAMMEAEGLHHHQESHEFQNHSHSAPHIATATAAAASFTTTSHSTHPTAPDHSLASTTTTTTQTSFVIGEMETTAAADLHKNPPPQQQQHHTPRSERMEGVEDMGTKAPLVVLDGANVAHHYAQAMANMGESSSLVAAQHSNKNSKPEPDAQGIQVATDYFLQCSVRVLVVLPQYWFRSKPRGGNNASENALMETPQLEILHSLKEKGLIVQSPPTDDDDAYALTIARREELRSLTKRNGEGPGFVLSNDLFRDAQARDPSGNLKLWLTKGRHETTGAGRISYTFGDMGTMNDRGERILDFIPNPRHPLVLWVEGRLLETATTQQQQYRH